MEVLLVLTILVVLGSFAVTQFSGIQSGAKISEARSQIGLFKSAIDYYHLGMGAYPTTLDDLVVQPSNDSNQRWQGPYLNPTEIPLDPWDATYRFQAPGKNNPNTYDLWSVGPDGQDGSDDDIGNWTQQ